MNTNIVFTKRMAGVIFKNWKEGKIEMTEQAVKSMYDTARGCEDAYSKLSFYQNNPAVDRFILAVEAIFENNLEDAQLFVNQATL